MTTSERTVTRATVLGVAVDGITMKRAVDVIMGWTESRTTHLAVGVNAYVCNQAWGDSVFRARYNSADLSYVDGQSIVVAARLLGYQVPERLATTDLVWPLAEKCAIRGKRVFLFGGSPGVADLAAQALERRAPGLQITARNGYQDREDDSALIDAILDFHPDVLLVGLGDRLQQEWIAEHRDVIGVPAILSCGGLFDWTSGSHRRAPKWMIGAGLEWLWRLLIEPRRLAGRYLLGNPLFLARLARQLISDRSSHTRDVAGARSLES
ncbi:MAG: hypothetical protein JWL94_1574 [Microbacteriaceae bacterium]|jgi:N-acetylglucosaminyldiphosphoundecaprenol N-acetyl-beta-D-mannosaminyltransferase|nr:hypothetical protein [Microbacteriaceae bacterium]HEV7955698.1 WecB/TagA/CpsF family glycosyltransferase [Marisediminicola sp.]